MDWIEFNGHCNIEASLLESKRQSSSACEQIDYYWTPVAVCEHSRSFRV